MKIVRTTITQTPLEMFQSKFDMPPRPAEKVPLLPESLDGLSNSALMDSYSEFMSWVSYAKSELVVAEIAEEKCANDVRVAESMALINQWGSDIKGDRVTIAKARRDIDPKVQEKTQKHLEARAYRKLVESLFERCERSSQVLSRELSRRIGLAPKERSNHRFSA